MNIAVASGKGGTGKTTVAVNLVAMLDAENVLLLDCDVEEPNAHLFLTPEIEEERPVRSFIPKVDSQACTHCGKCSDLCQFNAILTMKDNVLVFPELCHACLGCRRICPENAITDGEKEIGILSFGRRKQIRFISGRLRIGEAMSPPLIRKVKQAGLQKKSDVIIIDAPPGTSCPVIESVKDADFILLVTEPTPFGLNDLKLAVDMVKKLNIPFGVIVNRSTIGDRKTWEYCQDNQISILAEIPDDRKITEAYSRGERIIDVLPEYRILFRTLADKITKNIPVTEVA